jgi:hypothetical protein
MSDGAWFWLDVGGHQHRAQWLDGNPDRSRRWKTCTNNFNHKVGPDEWRLRVDSMEGPPGTKKAHGKDHEYLCVLCAMTLHNEAPPRQVVTETLW